MTYKLIIAERFESDLDEVMEYIAFRLYNPKAVQRLLNRIEETITALPENPFLYPHYHDEEIAKRGYRFVVISNFILFYIADEDTQTIKVERFIYGGRDISNNI